MTRKAHALLVGLVLVFSVVVSVGGGVVSPVAAQQAAANVTSPTTTPTPTPTATPASSPTPTTTTQAQSQTQTPLPTATPVPRDSRSSNATYAPGSYSISELNRPGVSPGENEFASTRLLHDYTPVGVQRNPPNPFQGGWQYADPHSTLESDTIRFVTARYGSEDIEPVDYELVVVYWQEKTVNVNGSGPVQVAANQTVERKTITFGPYRDFTEVDLLSYFDGTRRITMWLEYEGEEVARWQYKQHTIEFEKPPEIVSWGGFWSNALLFAGLPMLITGLGGMRVANRFLDRTAAGPMKGFGWYIAIGVAALFAVVILAYFEAAMIATRAPFIVGAFLGLAFVVYYVENAGRPDFTVEFTRRDLEHVKDAKNQEVKDGLFKQKRTVRIARRDDGKLLIVEPGFMNFLARVFADPAEIDETDLTTEVLVQDLNGSVEKEYLADPLEDQPIYVKTPSWNFHVPLFKQQDEDEHPALPAGESDDSNDGDGRLDTAKQQVSTSTRNAKYKVRSWIPPFNWDFVLKSALSLVLAVTATSSVLGLPQLGVLIGMVPIVAMSLHAEDGEARYNPAPAMGLRAIEIVAYDQNDYTRAESVSQLRKMLWDERLESVQDIEELKDEYDETLINRFFGPDEDLTQTNGESPREKQEVTRDD